MIKGVNLVERWLGKYVKIRLKDGKYYDCEVLDEFSIDSFIVIDKKGKTVQIFNSDISVIEEINVGDSI